MGLLSLLRFCVSLNNKSCIDIDYFGDRWEYVMGKKTR